MLEFTYTLRDEHGMHARPAGMLAKEAQKFVSSVTLGFGCKSADAKRVFSLMTLCAKCGDEICVRIEGGDEQAALEKLEAFVIQNL